MKAGVLAAAGLAMCAGDVSAQTRFVLADRTNDSLWAVDDLNGNGIIDEPGELVLMFNSANAAGTLGISNPTSLGVRSDGLVMYCDQLATKIYMMKDLNRDGDCQDIGESWIAAEAGNAAGVNFAFPTGAAFDPLGVAYIVNAGNGFGNDAVYRLVDLNGDKDFQDPGEIIEYVGTGFFGPGNGAYSPQELVFDPTATSPVVGYVHNSSSGLFGVFKFKDADGNGRADDAGEVTAYWDLTGSSGVTPGAGFALELDAARPGSMYVQQTATGGVDQVVRLTDLNGDGDAQDAGEAVLVYSTAEAGFTAIDLVSLANGQLLITDNSGKKVYVLTDLNLDGLFTGAGERAVFFANSTLMVGDIRQGSPIARVCVGNCDLSTVAPVLNVNDFQCFLNAFAAGDMSANCDSSTSPPILNVNDFSCFLNAFAAGCP